MRTETTTDLANRSELLSSNAAKVDFVVVQKEQTPHTFIAQRFKIDCQYRNSEIPAVMT